MTANTHSALSPSQAERWFSCPGSPREAVLRPPQPGSPAAAEGTACHALAEDLVNGNTTITELQTKVGEFVHTWDGYDVPITQEMVDGAILYAETVNADLVRMRAESGKRASLVVGRAEVEVTATSVDPEVHGTADYVTYQKGNALIVTDFKFGKKAVNPKENKQLGIYAVAAMDMLAGWALDGVVFKIVQPRAGGAAVRSWTAPMEWLRRFREDLKEAVRRTREKDAPLNPGAWCFFCPANTKNEETRCSALLKKKRAQVLADFSVIPVVKAGDEDDALDALLRAEETGAGLEDLMGTVACGNDVEDADALAELLGTAAEIELQDDGLAELMGAEHAAKPIWPT